MQMIHMKCQDLFSLKIKQEFFRMLSATILLGALRVKADCPWLLFCLHKLSLPEFMICFCVLKMFTTVCF